MQTGFDHHVPEGLGSKKRKLSAPRRAAFAMNRAWPVSTHSNRAISQPARHVSNPMQYAPRHRPCLATHRTHHARLCSSIDILCTAPCNSCNLAISIERHVKGRARLGCTGLPADRFRIGSQQAALAAPRPFSCFPDRAWVLRKIDFTEILI